MLRLDGLDALNLRRHLWVLVVSLSGCFSPSNDVDTEGSTDSEGETDHETGHETGASTDENTGEGSDETSTSTDASTSNSEGDTTTSGSSATSGSSSGTDDGDVTSGSESSETGDPCPAQTEGCPCGPADACDDGLTCLEGNMCVPTGMVLVSASTFSMGCNSTVDMLCQPDESPYHELQLHEYLIDRTEVTQAAFDVCVLDGACVAPTVDYTPADTPNLPVVGLSWDDAVAYCGFLDKRLPSEAEWELAARGTDGRRFPWGNSGFGCTRVNYVSCGSTLLDADSLPAGSSPSGLLHALGNVEEWVSDYYAADYYTQSPSSDPQGPSIGTTRVLRGASYKSGSADTRVSARFADVPDVARPNAGVRCAKDLPSAP